MSASDNIQPIAPGAALADSAVREGLATLERTASRSFTRHAGRKRGDLPVIRHLLGAFAWHACGYRFGRWMHVERGWGSPFDWWGWKRTYDTFQLLDRTGRPFAELLPRTPTALQAPSGRLRYAGDPAVAIAYLPEGAPCEDVNLATAGHLPVSEGLERARVLLPGAGGARMPYLDAVDERRPWLDDQPAKPPRPRR
jgi:hypothetical protein